MSMNPLCVTHLGRTEYGSAWDIQKRLFDLRAGGKIPDTLLLTEHDPVYTLGKSSDVNHLLSNESELREKGVGVFHIDRGGDVTFHGPGQLVGYPILDLNFHYLDAHRYLRDVEEVLIRTLAGFGIPGGRDPRYTGVWVEGEKIAAIGVKISRWITMHGFALNVNTDLSYFDRIIPCGIFHKGVTSMKQRLGRTIDLRPVADAIVREFAAVFGVEPHAVDSVQDFRFPNMENVEWLQAASQ